MGWLAEHIRSNIVGYLALVIAMGGTSYAAAALADNSVGTRHLRNGAVTTPKIRDHAVNRAKVKPGVVPFTVSKQTAVDFADESLPTPVATPDDPDRYHPLHFTMPFPGKAVVTASIPFWGQSCSAGIARAGLYLDAVPVPGTKQNIPGNSAPQGTVFTATVALAPGAHRVDVGVDCVDGNLSSGVFGAMAWTLTAAR